MRLFKAGVMFVGTVVVGNFLARFIAELADDLLERMEKRKTTEISE